MKDGHYDPTKFLKNFPGCVIQYFTDGKGWPEGDKVALTRKSLDVEEAVELQSRGCGVFFSVNDFSAGERKKENLHKINAVYVDMDVAKESDKLEEKEILDRKEAAWRKAVDFPLVPHYITETKNGFHFIWLASDIETEDEFIDLCKRLTEHFDGDRGGIAVNKVLRIPGFDHLKDVKKPFKCELVMDNSNIPRYGKRQFIKVLPVRDVPKDNKTPQEEILTAVASPEIKEACQIPVRAAIELSASLIGMNVSFRENADGSLQIIENGKETSAFVSSRGNFVHSSSGKKREGNAVTVAEYYLNEVGGRHYNRQEIAKILLGSSTDKSAPEETEQVESEDLPIIEFEKLRHMVFPKMEFIVDQLIVKGTLNMIVGDPGSHKTWFYQYIAYCIAYGLPVLGRYETFPTNILIVNVDDPLQLTKERMELIGFDETKHTDVFLWQKDVFMIDLEENTGILNQISTFMREMNIGLVVFDTLRQIHGGDENDSGDMTKVMKNLKSFAHENDAAILLVHHQRKNDGGFQGSNMQTPSGSIAIIGNTFSSLHLSKMKDGSIKVSKGKSKLSEIAEPFYMIMDSNAKGQDFFRVVTAPAKIDIEVIQDKIISFYDEKPEPRLTKKDFISQFAKEIKVPKNKITEAFKVLEDEGYVVWDGITRPKNVKYYIKSPELI